MEHGPRLGKEGELSGSNCCAWCEDLVVLVQAAAETRPMEDRQRERYVYNKEVQYEIKPELDMTNLDVKLPSISLYKTPNGKLKISK